MKVYALRHKATGEFMPARMHRTSSRGWSHWIPGPPYDAYDRTPRFFPTRKGADNARVLWAMGIWERQYSYDEESNPAPMKPPVPRHKDDLEVVTFNLIEETK